MAFQFYIEIEGLENPPVWRRVSVPEDFNFLDLSDVIQAAFGWSGDHAFTFAPKGYGSSPSIGISGDEDKDAEGVLLRDIFKKVKQQFVYIYDFGDDWFHNLRLENITHTVSNHAELLEGGGACPPEDCGGVFGYSDMLDILADPENPEYHNMREWLGLEEGAQWDPEAIDLEALKEDVRSIEF